MILIVFLVQWGIPQNLLAASDGVFLNHSTAIQIAEDLTFYKTNYPKLEKMYYLCDKETEFYKKGISNKEETITALNKDKDDLKFTTNEFKDKYESTNTKLAECINKTPSKLTWFSVGVISTLVTIVLGFIVAGR